MPDSISATMYLKVNILYRIFLSSYSFLWGRNAPRHYFPFLPTNSSSDISNASANFIRVSIVGLFRFPVARSHSLPVLILVSSDSFAKVYPFSFLNCSILFDNILALSHSFLWGGETPPPDFYITWYCSTGLSFEPLKIVTR